MRPLLCLGRCRLGSGPFGLGLLVGHITQRGGLVLLGLAFFRQRFVAAYGSDCFLGSTLHLFRDAFDPCLRSGLIRHGRLPYFHLVLLALPWALPATRRHGIQTQRARTAFTRHFV